MDYFNETFTVNLSFHIEGETRGAKNIFSYIFEIGGLFKLIIYDLTIYIVIYFI